MQNTLHCILLFLQQILYEEGIKYMKKSLKYSCSLLHRITIVLEKQDNETFGFEIQVSVTTFYIHLDLHTVMLLDL